MAMEALKCSCNAIDVTTNFCSTDQAFLFDVKYMKKVTAVVVLCVQLMSLLFAVEIESEEKFTQ